MPCRCLICKIEESCSLRHGMNYCIRNGCVTCLLVFLFAITAFGQEAGGEKVIAEGDGFSLTRKQFEEYRSAIAPKTGQADNKNLLDAIIKYELFSREYAENHKELGGVPYSQGSATIAMKVQAASIYTQQILHDYILPEQVIESYYLSYPERFKAGNSSGGGKSVLPLDDKLKKEIIFFDCREEKKAIIEDTVQNLMAKYHIRIITEYF